MVELATIASAYSSHVIESFEPLPSQPLADYWIGSRRRLSRWLRALKHHAELIDATDPKARPERLREAKPLLEEIFAADMLARVWGAVLAAADRRRNSVHSDPVARNVLIGQLQARQFALELMLRVEGSEDVDLLAVDRLRRHSERWSDVLLGHLVVRYEVADFPFDADRARDFGEQHIAHDIANPDAEVWNLILAGLRLGFAPAWSTDDHLFGPTCEIATAVIATFPPSAFQQAGLFKSIVRGRVERGALIPEFAPLTVRRIEV